MAPLLICVAGVQRGGQHFIMNYIMSLFPRVLFKNDCKFRLGTKPGFNYSYELFVNGKKNRSYGSSDYKVVSHINVDAVVLGGESICVHKSGENDGYNITIDSVVEEAKKFVFKDMIFIQIIRNPLNVLASCIERGQGRNNIFNRDDYVQKLMNTLLDIIDKMENGGLGKKVIYINYDRFIQDYEHRKLLCEFCDSIDRQKNAENSMKFVQGSSFGNSTKFLDRHSTMKDNSRFKRLVSDKLYELAEKHFDLKQLKS